MNAEVKISVSVKSSYRENAKLWRPTNIYVRDFQLITDLDNYLSVTDDFSDTIYTYVAAERALPAEPSTHYTIRLGNPTHPIPAKGVIPLPKGHLDGSLSDLEFESSAVLKDTLNNIIGDLKTVAKY